MKKWIARVILACFAIASTAGFAYALWLVPEIAAGFLVTVVLVWAVANA
jgi:hypothetical protein